MGDRLQSYDQHGPMIPLGSVQLWMMHDPIGIGRDERFDFTVDLWQHAKTESQAIVSAPGCRSPIKTGSTYNDFYGFGTSRREAIEEAEKFDQQFSGANLQITVVTTLTVTPVMHDAGKPAFYTGAVRAFALPVWRWFVAATGQSLKDEYARQETVTIWREGDATPAGESLQKTLDQLRAADGAAHIRKGDLR